jgi:hypothetical protein
MNVEIGPSLITGCCVPSLTGALHTTIYQVCPDINDQLVGTTLLVTLAMSSCRSESNGPQSYSLGITDDAGRS